MDFKTEQPIRQQKNIRAAWQPSRPTLYKHEKHYEKAPERKTGGYRKKTQAVCAFREKVRKLERTSNQR